MADSFTPNIAPQKDGSGNAPEQAQQHPDATEPVPITEQEVGEYREQDRYLPVSPVPHLLLPVHDRFFPVSSALKLHSFLFAFWPLPTPLLPPQKRLQMFRVS